MIIGITGGIGSGKSKVATLLGKKLDSPVIDTDKLCKQLLERGEAGYLRFVQEGGQRFLDGDGDIDRVKLREELFADHKLLLQLESILHPLVLKSIQNRVKKDPDSLIIVEVPLLFESGWQNKFDIIISVFSDEKTCIDRVVERDRVSREAVSTIIAAQMSAEEKNRRADFVIENSAGWHETDQQLVDLVAKLQEKLREA